MKNTPQPAKGTLLRLVRTTRKYPGEILAKDINSKSTEIEEQMASKPRKKDATSLVVKKKIPITTTMAQFFCGQIKCFG